MAKMAAHVFNENGQMHEVEIPDIFDVLEGGEDEGAVKFLLGFAGDDESEQSNSTFKGPINLSFSGAESSASSDCSKDQDIYLTKEGRPRKRDPVDPARCIYTCESCDKAFTTKFNLKRHINLHCNASKEAGVPIQGPPSASMPSKKARERRLAMAAMGMSAADQARNKTINERNLKMKFKKKSQYKQAFSPLSDASSPGSNGVSTATRCNIGVGVGIMNATEQGLIQVQQAVAKSNQQKFVAYQVTSPDDESKKSSTTSMVSKCLPTHEAIMKTGKDQVVTRQVLLSKSNTASIIGQLQGSVRTIPILQTTVDGVIQTIPVSVIQESGEGGIITSTVHIQPHALTIPTKVKLDSNDEVMTDESASLTATLGQPGLIMASSSLLSPFLSGTTPAQRGALEDNLCSPPDDLFDSEDDNASSVATTTEAPSPTSLDYDLNDYTLISSDSSFSFNRRFADSSAYLTSVSNTLPDFMEENSEDNDEASSNGSLNLPSNPPRGQLQEIPRGWIRKIITTAQLPGFQKVFYYNNAGKKFSNQEEIDQYFARLGQTVKPGLFNFEPPVLVDEDDDDEDEDISELKIVEEATPSNNAMNGSMKMQTV